MQGTINTQRADIDQNRTDIDSNDVELADHESRISQNETDIAAVQNDYVDLSSNQTVAGEKTFSDNMVLNGDLEVNGTTTTVNSATLEVADANITINDGGSDASSEGAGLTVERVGTDGSFKYENALDNKFKIGALGNEEEISGIIKDTLVNLQALISPSSSNLYFATDTLEHFRSDGTSLQPLGSGGGGGGLDNWLAENFETTVAADFSSGNSATFEGGGTLDGVLSDETTSPISGVSSLKYVAGSSSVNDYFASPVVAVDFKQQDNDSGFTFYFTWDGTVEVEAVIWDETNSEKLSSVLDVIETTDGATRYSASFYPPSNCTEVKYGFHFLSAPSNGDELIIDDVEFSTNPFVYKNLTENQTVEYYETGLSIAVDASGTAPIQLPSLSPLNYFGDNLITVTNESSHTRFTANRNIVAHLTFEGAVSVGNGRIEVYKNGTKVSGNAGGSTSMNQGHNLTLSSSDYIELKYRGSASTITDFTIGIHAQAEAESVITPARSNLSDWVTYTPTTQGFGTPVNIDAFYRRVGDSLEIQITMDSGTTSASEAQIGLPNSLEILSSLTQVKLMGVLTRGASGGTSLTKTVIGTSGDTYVNIGNQSAGNGLTPINGNGVVATGEKFSLYATIPIQGWSSDAVFLAAVPVQKIAYVKDVKSSGTNGGTFTSGAWQTRDLNTITGSSEIVSLSSNQFTLQTGRYSIEAQGMAYGVNNHQIKLYNTTDSNDVILGLSAYSSNSQPNSSSLFGEIEINEPKVFELQHQGALTQASNGFGIATSFGSTVYAQIKIAKLR